MIAVFPVTITTAEELRLLEQERRTWAREPSRPTALFDEFDYIRAHGMGVKIEKGYIEAPE